MPYVKNSEKTYFLFKCLTKLVIHIPQASVSLLCMYHVICNMHFTNNSTEYKLNFPDTLQSLVGQQNARHGIIKIFNALQETRANKHLLYVSNFKPTRG